MGADQQDNATGLGATTGATLVDAGRPATAFSAPDEAIAAAHERLEHTLGSQDDREGPLRYRDAVSTTFHGRPPFIFAWPDSLYIPAQADWHGYWITPPPDDHRYRYAWSDPGGASSASIADGHLFAWNNVSDLRPAYTGHAGVGVQVVPTATLSYLTVGADIDLVAESRWWYLPGPEAGFASVSYRGTAYLAVWQIDPVTGAWELLRPFGTRTLFSFSRSGQGGTTVSSQHVAFDDLRTTVQVQSGRRYAVSVSFEVHIDHDTQDRQGRPYQRRDGDDLRLWGSIVGTVSSITASTKVLIP